MLNHFKMKGLKLRSDYVWQFLLYIVALAILIAIFFFFRVSVLKNQPEDRLSLGAGLFAFFLANALILHHIINVMRNGHAFYLLGERKKFYSKDFNPTKYICIGPLFGLEKKTLIIKLRWRPQMKDIPKVKSFRLHSHASLEPTATFKLKLVGQKEDVKTDIDVSSIVQKIDITPRGQDEQSSDLYDDWREVDFLIPASFDQCYIEINLSVENCQVNLDKEIDSDFHDGSRTNPQQLWVDMFVGLNIKEIFDLKSGNTSNVGSVDFNVI